MANKQITEFPNASTLTGAETVHVVQGGNSRKTTVGGLSSVVLANVDLAVTDIQLSGTPVIITGVDQFRELNFNWRAVKPSGDAFIELSTDGGSTFASGASDYTVFFNGATAQNNGSNLAGILLGPGTTDQAVDFHLKQMASAEFATFGIGHAFATGTGGNSSFYTRRNVAEVNNAIRVYSSAAITSGRLTVTGIF